MFEMFDKNHLATHIGNNVKTTQTSQTGQTELKKSRIRSKTRRKCRVWNIYR